MNPRQELILKLIVDEYIRCAEPIGSKFLCEISGLDCSSATVRNDMVVLERAGFIRQPHTSAGRIPTEKAYVYYLQKFVDQSVVHKREVRFNTAFQKAKDQERAVKALAKTLVELSGETAIVAFGQKWSYYTGVSNLFAKPDFHNLERMQHLSEVVDRFDEVLKGLFDRVSDDALILLGSENPFGASMSTILVQYRLPNERMGLFGLLGPMRMDYQRNIQLVKQAKYILDEQFGI